MVLCAAMQNSNHLLNITVNNKTQQFKTCETSWHWVILHWNHIVNKDTEINIKIEKGKLPKSDIVISRAALIPVAITD